MEHDATPTETLSWSSLIRRLHAYAIFTMDRDRMIDSWNEGVRDLLGFEEHEFVGRTADLIFTEEDRRDGEPRREMEAALETGEGGDNRWHVRKDGTRVWVNGVVVPVRDRDDEVLGYMKIIRDETQRHEAEGYLERQIREQKAIVALGAYALGARQMQPLMERATRLVAETLAADDVEILELDAEGDEGVVRSSTTGRTGERRRLDRRSLDRLMDADPEVDVGAPVAEAWVETPDVLLRTGAASGIGARIRGRGRPFGMIEATCERPFAYRDEDLHFLRSIANILAAAAEQQRLHEELSHRAEHDELTNLPNRKVFEERLEVALQQASRGEERVAVLFLDLDRFKNVNDSLGHQAGDDLLRSVACRLREAVRSWDTVARLGGDEFVVLLPSVPNEAEIAHVCQRLLGAFERPFTIQDREILMHTTIGAAVYPSDGEDAVSLLRAADTAMYDGKASRRSTFHFYTAAQNAMAKERLALERDLRHARDRGEFELDFQPQVDLADGSVTAFEALLRWRHPQRGRLSPDAFLGLADGLGLSVAIGEWLMSEAFRRHATWKRDRDGGFRLAINVAPSHFMQPTFPASLRNLAEEAGIAPGDVDVEITESAVLSDPDLVARHVSTLKEMGASVTLDDFGTGYSSLMYLRNLPIDRLKIDESFTHGLDEPGGTALPFVEAIVLLANKLDMTVIMEGVETDDQLRRVRELGCRHAQGHVVSTPLPSDEVLPFLRERRR